MLATLLFLPRAATLGVRGGPSAQGHFSMCGLLPQLLTLSSAVRTASCWEVTNTKPLHF